MLSDNAELEPEFIKNGIKVVKPKFIFKNKIFKLVAASLNIIIDLLKDRTSITHFYLPEAYLIGMPLCKLFNPKGIRIMSRRSLNNYQLKHQNLAKIEHRLHKFTDIVLTNSKAAIKQLSIEEGVAVKKIKLIHNGINIPDINFIESKIKKSNKIFIEFVIVANLIEYKGHTDLLKAFSLIRKKIERPWKLHIIGNDSANIKKLLIKQAIDYAIFDNIVWHGKVEDPGSILAKVDIGILASHEEGFSNAVLEKMAYGLPMVVTDVGGNSEAVLDKVCGYVVPAKSPRRLADALLLLANNEKLRFSMGEEARKRAIDKFNIDKCVDSYNEIYYGVILGK